MKKISNLMKREFESEAVYGDKYIKIKVKSYGDTINRNFQAKKITKENTKYTCLSVISLDSVIKVGKKVLPANAFGRMQIWNKKKNKTKNLINDNLNLCSSDDKKCHDKSDAESDDESDDKPNYKSSDKSDDEYSDEKICKDSIKSFNY